MYAARAMPSSGPIMSATILNQCTPCTFLTEPNEADTISHKSIAASFSMATNASTGGTCRPSAPPLAPDGRREPLLPVFPPPRPAADEELVTDEAILSQASRSGPSLLLHLKNCGARREVRD